MADDLDEVAEPEELADDELEELPDEELEELPDDDLEADDELVDDELDVELPVGDDALETPAHELLLARGGLDTHKFPGKDQWHEHRLAFVMCQAVAAIHELFNSNFHLESLSAAGSVIPGRGPHVR